MSECVGRDCCVYVHSNKLLENIKEDAYQQGGADERAKLIKRIFRVV